MDVDPENVVARARAAVSRSEVLADLAREAHIHALTAQASRRLVTLAPVVEAELLATLSRAIADPSRVTAGPEASTVS